MSYKVIPSNRKITYIKNESIPDHMPKVPMRLLITAPSNSGKTVIMGSLLREEYFAHKEIFKGNVFVFSSTFSLNDPAWDECNIKKENSKIYKICMFKKKNYVHTFALTKLEEQ